MDSDNEESKRMYVRMRVWVIENRHSKCHRYGLEHGGRGIKCIEG